MIVVSLVLQRSHSHVILVVVLSFSRRLLAFPEVILWKVLAAVVPEITARVAKFLLINLQMVVMFRVVDLSAVLWR